MDARLRKESLVRFGVGTLLLLMTCVAGFLYGYRSGWNRAEQDHSLELFTVQVYQVKDLVTSRKAPAASGPTNSHYQDVNRLVEAVLDKHYRADGSSTKPHEGNACLVVSATTSEHERVAELLEAIREIKAAKAPTRWTL